MATLFGTVKSMQLWQMDRAIMDLQLLILKIKLTRKFILIYTLRAVWKKCMQEGTAQLFMRHLSIMDWLFMILLIWLVQVLLLRY